MKRDIRNVISCFLFAIIIGCAGIQVTKEKSYSEVMTVPGFSKAQIFDQTRMWMAEKFRSAKAVIEYENRDNGTIIGNGNTRYIIDDEFLTGVRRDWRYNFTIRVDAKDDKFKVTFSNISVSWPGRPGAPFSPPTGPGERDLTEEEMRSAKNEFSHIAIRIKGSIKESRSKEKW